MTDTPGGDTDQFRPRVDREFAEEEYRLYKQHGRPPRPYYGKCTNCGDMWEFNGGLMDADYGARRHAGVHSGLDNEHAEIVIIDNYGRELFRVHAIYRPEDEPIGCPNCGAEEDSKRIACPECGHIPEEHRLVADGSGADE